MLPRYNDMCILASSREYNVTDVCEQLRFLLSTKDAQMIPFGLTKVHPGLTFTTGNSGSSWPTCFLLVFVFVLRSVSMLKKNHLLIECLNSRNLWCKYLALRLVTGIFTRCICIRKYHIRMTILRVQIPTEILK